MIVKWISCLIAYTIALAFALVAGALVYLCLSNGRYTSASSIAAAALWVICHYMHFSYTTFKKAVK